MRKNVLGGLVLVTALGAAGALIYVGRSVASARRPPRVNRRAEVAQSPSVPRGAVSGRVVDPESNPVAGAEVKAFGAKYHFGKVPNTITDEQGAFVLEGIPPGVYDISASKEEEGYGDTGSSIYSADGVQNPRVTVRPGQAISDVSVQLGPKCTWLVVRVNDRQTGKKLPAGNNMIIRLTREDRAGAAHSTGMDENGDFSILVPPAAYSVEISVPGYKRLQYHGVGAESAAKTRHAAPRKKEVALSLDREQ